MSSRTAAHRPLAHGNRSRREAPQPVAKIRSLTYLDKLGSRPSPSGWVRFWWARACRIWPVHALVTALFGIWLFYKAGTGRPGPVAYQTVQPVLDFPHWVEQMLMVQMWHREALAGSSWVGPAWSISAEWAAYTVFPVLVLVLWRLRNAHPALLGALGVAAMVPLGYLSTTETGLDFPYAWALRIGSGFVSGALICLAVRRIPRTDKVDRIAGGVAVLAAAEVLVLLWADSAKVGSTNDSALAVIAFPVIVGALALSTRGPSRWLSTDTAVLGGKVSFAMYLVHIPVFEIGYTLMDWHPRLAPGTGLGTLLLPQMFMATMVLSYLVHRFVEEPARRSMRGFGLPGRSAVPVPRVSAEQPEEPAPWSPLDAADRIPAARAGVMAGSSGGS
ncbi:acyltransferase family protein [Blastococcus atacamensis]|uniref:acyltransferase family protein n=1 Tax=Blastococcus atacamensis TaxID=2070508 RepID=UPI0018E45706|nr:acyltransferase [Blastococcus atacamensis]